MGHVKRIAACLLAVLLVALMVPPAFAEDGGWVYLAAEDADLTNAPDVVLEPDEPPYNLGGWLPGNTVSWTFDIAEAGDYNFEIEYARPGDYPAAVGNIEMSGEGDGLYHTYPTNQFTAEPTSDMENDWSVYAVNQEWVYEMQPGTYTVSITPDASDEAYPHFINLRGITVAMESAVPPVAGESPEAEAGEPEAGDPEANEPEASALEGIGQVQDLAGLFTEQEASQLTAAAEGYAANYGAHFVILTLDDSSVDSLEDYTREFYEDSLAGTNGVNDAAVMSINMGTRRVAADFFGDLRAMVSEGEASTIREAYTPDLSSGNFYAAAELFLTDASALVGAKREEASESYVMPEIDLSQIVYDYVDALTPEEEDSLRQEISAVTEEHDVSLYVVFSDLSEYDALYEFEFGFERLLWDSRSGESFALLIVGAQPEGGTRTIRTDSSGRNATRKIGFNQMIELRDAASLPMDDGDAYGAAMAFITGAEEDLGSFLPSVQMADGIGWVLRWSALAALALAGIVLLVLRIHHGFGFKKVVSAGNYIVGGSLSLGYSQDIFIGSHTTQTKIEKPSDSGGSSGSSSDSSRSEGSF